MCSSSKFPRHCWCRIVAALAVAKFSFGWLQSTEFHCHFGMLLRRVCLRLHICVMVSILFVDVRLVSIYFFSFLFFSFVEYILHKYGISAISFACWTFCIFQSHIMISGTSWKKFQNSLVEWQKETQTEWNKTWALSAIRRETIDTPVYFCTVCRCEYVRAHQSVMKFMNANRSTNEFMCQCMFTIQ